MHSRMASKSSQSKHISASMKKKKTQKLQMHPIADYKHIYKQTTIHIDGNDQHFLWEKK